MLLSFIVKMSCLNAIVAARWKSAIFTFRRDTILSAITDRSRTRIPMIEVATIECVAGRGIRGDRYFDFKDDYKGQITFFSLDVFDELCQSLQA